MLLRGRRAAVGSLFGFMHPLRCCVGERSATIRKTLAPSVILAILAILNSPQKLLALGAQPVLVQPVIESQTVTLRNSTHRLARPEFDRGAAPPSLPMSNILLVLKRAPEQEAQLQQLLDEQQDPSSPNYHHWLTPEEFGRQFGPADEDVQVVTQWLKSHGFTVSNVAKGKTTIEFSGTAAQVEETFHTAIHKYVVNGEEHWANATDPQIPAALAPVVAGFASLHNFVKRPQLIRTGRTVTAAYRPGSRPQFTSSSGNALAPGDYAIIYNINPVYQAGTNGSGATIAVVARSNIKLQDITQFRSIFGLVANNPQIVVNGTDPGVVKADESESVLDASWAGAVAPNATVKLVVSKTTNTTDGTDLSEQYIIDHNLADVMTESYGDCEAGYSGAQANFYASLAQQAAAQGITYTVSSGDNGVAGCDDPSSDSASLPASVSVLASTPYTIAVGGTEFNENGNNNAYWSPNNSATMVSALSYIPEDAWNESCTPAQCGASNAGLWSTSGGQSIFFQKPSWQVGVPGIPPDGVRDVPDVALTAASHDGYLLCLDNSCQANKQGEFSFQVFSGTSASAPSFAGIMALVKQYVGSRLGQADYVLYRLATLENLLSCNASLGQPLSTCIFNDVTLGTNSVPGMAGFNAGGGYDLTTGLGSVNVANLIYWWTRAPNVAAPVSNVAQISVGSDGTAWGITSSGLIYWLNATQQGAQSVPGNLMQIAVAANGNVWGLNDAGSIYRLDASNGTWQLMPGNLAQIAIGADGDVWGINSGGLIYHFDTATQNWDSIPGYLVQIAVGFDGAVWGINAAHLVYRFNPGTRAFEQVPGALAQIAVGADGDVWGLDDGGAIYHFDPLIQNWTNIPGVLSHISVGAGNTVWGVNSFGNAYEYNGNTASWFYFPGSVSQVSAGANGAVWAISTSGQPFELVPPVQSAHAFHAVPGSLAQIATGPDGQVWGLNGAGQIYHFNPVIQNWDFITGNLSQIAVGFGNNVWGVNASHQIFHFDFAAQNWDYIPGELVQVAVGANGSVWGINVYGQSYFYNAAAKSWTGIPGGLTQISVGADGSAWGINAAGVIYAFNPATQGWNSIAAHGFEQVSVGSATNIWALDYAEDIFSYDSRSGTLNPVNGNLTQISVAFDGTVAGVNSGELIYEFNPSAQAWTNLPGYLTRISVGAGEIIWGINAAGFIYYYR